MGAEDIQNRTFVASHLVLIILGVFTMNFNRKFNPNVWEAPRPVHQIPPFVNSQQNFFQNQGNFQFQNSNFNQNFQQNQNIRPLLSLPINHLTEHSSPQSFRKFNNNNNNNRRSKPGPACSRNNFNNNSQRWSKDKRREEFNNREGRSNDIFDNHNRNNRSTSRGDERINDHTPTEGSEVPKFKSLVEHLKEVQNSTRNESNQDTSKSDFEAICAKNASEASQKLLTQLKTMDKDGVKDLINNPKQPYKKKVLNIQARVKLREQMRKKLKQLGNECDSSDYQFEPDECIDYEKIPESLIAQIGKTIDMNLDDDMDLSESINEDFSEAGDIEVVTKNLGNDFLMGSEMLLMNGFSLLAESEQETDVEIKRFEECIETRRLPPLPAESQSKPPSPPPEPVAAPVKLPEEKAAFCSDDKPWAPIHKTRPSFNDNDWDIESAKNPDPPSSDSLKEVVKEPTVQEQVPTPVPLPVPSVPATPSLTSEKHSLAKAGWDFAVASLETNRPSSSNDGSVKKDSVPVVPANVDEWDKVKGGNTEEGKKGERHSDSLQRAGETYGDYRRRLNAERDARNLELTNENVNRPANDNNKQIDEQNSSRGGSNGRNDNWTSNSRRNNQNDNRKDQNSSNQQGRKSRFEMNRGRDQQQNRFQNQRNSSRDTSTSLDVGRNDRAFDDVKDVHNYRFQNEKKNSQEPDIDRLNTLLNPKPLQFKGSFNKRSQNNSNFNQRGSSRNRTPVNSSMDRDFDESLLPAANDVRPCLSTLRKVMDIDAEMTRVHDKIHGIDKVISNLQSERIGYQKSFTRLQHDRKVLFENLMKRAMSNAESEKSDRQPKENESAGPSVTPVPSTSQKSVIEKKLQTIVDQKKRKHDEQLEEPKKKKQALDVMETTSAAEKAAQIQKERREEELRQANLEKKRLKKLRRERQRADQARLEEKVRQEAEASTITTIKQEPKEKSVEKVKSHKHKQHEKSQKSDDQKKVEKSFFKQNEILQVENYKVKNFSVKLNKVTLSQSLVNIFISKSSLEIDVNDWKKWCKPVKQEPKVKVKEVEKPTKAKSKSPELVDDPLAICDSNVDPLAIDEIEEIISPPTPGSNLTNDDSMLIEIPTEQDYSEWTGNFAAHEHPIVHLQNVLGKFIVCATEGGKILKYHLKDGKLAAVFSKHTEICNSFLYDHNGSVYTVSSDGFLHKIKFKTFQLVASEDFKEALQVIEKSKAGIYVGTKTGRIFRLKTDLTERESEPICNLGALILCMRAAREGSRNILLVSSRTHPIQVRDASDGLLLRTLSDDLCGTSIYDMLIEGSTIYCGSNRHEIFAVDFTTGALKKSRPCGAGAICVKLYKNYLIAACYDGNIYIFNTLNDDDAVNICGPSNMLLAMDLWDNKIIASTKDRTLKIMTIPT